MAETPNYATPQDAGKRATTDAEILAQGRERMRLMIDEYSQLRQKQRDDLLFSMLDQWPADVRNARENDPNGARPCLTIDQINQYIVQVVNDMRQNRPSIKMRPVDDKADVKTAEVFQGLARQIEDRSSAQVPYITAGESAVRIGEGYFRLVTEYESETSFNQVLRVKRVPDPLCCFLGPHIMPDGSDAPYGFIFEDIPTDQFRRDYPNKKYDAVGFNEIEERYRGDWMQNQRIRVAEYFYFDHERKTLCFYPDGTVAVKGEYQGKAEPVQERETIIRTTKWVKMTGAEVLDKRDWPGKFIPIIKVTGKEGWVDGKRVTWGLVRPAKDSLRMYNFWASAITEKIALSPKAPFVGAVGQFEGNEEQWKNANRVNYAYLEYKPTTVEGMQVPPPQRQMPAPIEAAMVQQLAVIREDVQASLGMFRASLGKEQPNQSGKAILALTRESDTGTYHFQDNLSLAIMYLGRQIVDIAPKIYDTKRVLQILGEDGNVMAAEIDPEQAEAVREIDMGEGKVKRIYNLGVGEYDVTVTVGPSFNTKRMEAATLFTDLANSAKDPASAAIVRYLAIKNSDFNGADVAAKMLEKTLPPGVIEKEGEIPHHPQDLQKIAMMEQAGNQLVQENQELKAGAQQDMMKIEVQHKAKMQEIDLDAQVRARQSELERIEAEEKARLARWQAEEEMKLRIWQAEQEIAIKERLARAQAEAVKTKAEQGPSTPPH